MRWRRRNNLGKKEETHKIPKKETKKNNWNELKDINGQTNKKKIENLCYSIF